ncbi:MAG: peptidylprolyl isomerase [Oligoflexia bacterium]|nr:peptidylprolyl isomerase [Oligoflexia bacterium]
MASSASSPQSNRPKKSPKWLPIVFLAVIVLLLLLGIAYSFRSTSVPVPPPSAPPAASNPGANNAAASPLPSPSASASPLASPSPTTPSSPSPLDLTVNTDGLSHSTIAIDTPRGIIRFKLYTNDAPETVHRFVELVQKGFYNGLTFHRVEPDFVIQGGDPQGTGRGGSGTKLKAEFNSRHHLEGTIAMARTSDPNSADSQFYIALKPLPQLDNNYTVFGQVIEGLDVIHKIQVGDKMTSVRIE